MTKRRIARGRRPTAGAAWALAAGLTVWLALVGSPAAAQLRQYVTPGELALIEGPQKESLENAIRRAPWEAGRVKIQPRLSIGDLQRIDNVFDTGDADTRDRVSDWRLTASAGLDAYLPAGEKTVFSAFVRPGYSWWNENDQLRRLNWSYGAAAFGYFNRLSTRLTLKRTEAERLLNSELRIPATIRQEQIALDVDVQLDGPWQLFAAVSRRDSSYPNARDLEEQAPNLASLERNEEIASLGLAYDVPNRFNLGLGWRVIESRFLDDPDGRSNKGSYPFLRVVLPGNRLRISAEGGLRKLEFANGEDLGSRDEAIGTVQTTWSIGRRTSLAVYAARDLVYSAVDTGGFFNSQRFGTALSWGTGRQLTLRLFAESGEDRFESAGGSNVGRLDDYGVVGLQASFPLRERLMVQIGITDSQLDSNFDEFDRSLTVLRSMIALDLPDLPF